MKIKILALIEVYKEKRKELINPDELDWGDIGFDTPPDEWETVNDFLEKEENLDYEQQIGIRYIDEIIDHLKIIIGEK